MPAETVRVGEALKTQIKVANRADFYGKLRFGLDSDLPKNERPYVDAVSGDISWTPRANHAGKKHEFVVSAYPSANPEGRVSEKLVVDVASALALAQIEDLEAAANQPVQIKLELAENINRKDRYFLVFDLHDKNDASARLDPMTGVFSWTPTVRDAGKTYLFSARLREYESNERSMMIEQSPEMNFGVTVALGQPPSAAPPKTPTKVAKSKPSINSAFVPKKPQPIAPPAEAFPRVDPFSFELPGGKTFGHSVVGFDRSLQSKALEARQPAQAGYGWVVERQGDLLFVAQFGVSPGSRGTTLNQLADGPAFVLNHNDLIRCTMSFQKGKLHGKLVLRATTRERHPRLYCEYKDGSLDGVCCLFEKGNPRLATLWTAGKRKSTLLISEGKIVATHEGESADMKEDAVEANKDFLRELAMIEKAADGIVSNVRSQVSKWRRGASSTRSRNDTHAEMNRKFQEAITVLSKQQQVVQGL